MDTNEMEQAEFELRKAGYISAAFFKKAGLKIEMIGEEDFSLPDIVTKSVEYAIGLSDADIVNLTTALTNALDLPEFLRGFALVHALNEFHEEIRKTIIMVMVGMYMYLNDPTIVPSDFDVEEMAAMMMKNDGVDNE